MLTQYVPAGEYYITSSDERVKLVALLGTCVGIALFDFSAGVGGICHILLAEPNDPTDVWQPNNYASTALPVFLDELLQKGAHRDRLEAVVAGGSLSAPFSSRDLNMDIGGRNSEAVLGFLDRHCIPITRAETGGCYAMNLSMLSENCVVEISHVMQNRMLDSSIACEAHVPSKDEIRQAITEIKPIPQVALKLVRMLRSDDYNIEKISNELHNDQVMSAKLLSFCNSAYFGFKSKVDSVERAILFLGGKYLIEAIVSTAVDSFYEQSGLGGYTLLKGGMFRHSTGVANIARIIARITGLEDEDTAYTAGLLHDIGKVVLDRFVSKAQPLFYSVEQAKVDDFIQLEQRHFRCDHQIIGRKLAKMWDLPENLKEVISYHHTPGKAKEHRTLTTMIYVADVLASFVMAGIEVGKIQKKSFKDAMAELELSSAMVPEIIGQVPWNRLMYN